jgi:hypothetical protein
MTAPHAVLIPARHRAQDRIVADASVDEFINRNAAPGVHVGAVQQTDLADAVRLTVPAVRGDPNAKTPGRPTETRPARWNSAAVLQPTLNEGNAMQPTDQTAVSDNARRADRKVALHSKLAIAAHAVHLNEGSRS